MSEVAQIILQQLGGRKFLAMTGATSLAAGPNKLTMRLRSGCKSKITSLVITLDASDTYTMTFGKMVKYDYVVVKEVSGVYCDMLQEVFTDTTGLYTSL